MRALILYQTFLKGVEQIRSVNRIAIVLTQNNWSSVLAIQIVSMAVPVHTNLNSATEYMISVTNWKFFPDYTTTPGGV